LSYVGVLGVALGQGFGAVKLGARVAWIIQQQIGATYPQACVEGFGVQLEGRVQVIEGILAVVQLEIDQAALEIKPEQSSG